MYNGTVSHDTQRKRTRLPNHAIQQLEDAMALLIQAQGVAERGREHVENKNERRVKEAFYEIDIKIRDALEALKGIRT